MANSKSAQKAHERSERKRVFNLRRLRAMRAAVKKVEALAASKDAAVADALSVAYKAVDKAAKRGVIKKNTGARIKSRIARIASNVSS